jgi:pyrimidine deaminase RibD-like protein
MPLKGLIDGRHLTFMRMALEEAQKCIATPTAFSVGCVIVVHSPHAEQPITLTTGYSRELPGNTHAEANALAKARALSSHELSQLLGVDSPPDLQEILASADVYTTMEPCSVRTSGLAPCADALISAKVKCCFIGVAEPDDFVVCEGAQKLKEAGVEVFWLPGLQDECLQEARRGHAVS